MNRSHRLPRLASGLVLLVLVPALSGCPGDSDLRFTTIFKDAKGLAPEAEVVYRGLAIGEVESVGFEDGLVAVELRIDAEHGEQVCGDSSFRIDTKAQPPQVLMTRAPGACTMMLAGSTVRGTEGHFDAFSQKSKALYRQHSQAMQAEAERFAESLEEWSKSPEAEKMKALAATLAKDAEELTRLGQEEFEKRWPEIEARVEDLLEEMRESGQSDEAEKLEQELGE